MPANQSVVVRAAVSVAQMAKMLGLSRGHFWTLCKAGVFPMPAYDIRTRRPLFTADMQKACLEVRHSNVGIDGRYVMFYERTAPRTAPQQSGTGGRPRRGASQSPCTELIEALGQLGLVATAPQVTAAVQVLYPQGLAECTGEVIRTVFRHLRRSISA